MNLSQVKLIVSDLDGTLLNSNHEVSSKFFKLFKILQSKNILFVAASGRPYYSMIDKLAPIKNDIIIVSENGGLAVKKNDLLISNTFKTENLNAISDIILNLKDTHPVFCTKDKAYVISKSKKLMSLLSEYYSNYDIIETIADIKEDIYKIALYHEESSEKYIYPSVKHLESNFKVKVSANHWVDISENIANKGYAIKHIQELHNITEAETMVFGDYNNDIEMLQLAHFSYAMDNAHPHVKAVANFTTKTNDENGVEFIIKQLIDSLD
ncbi:HAD family hydrolase [Olleya sp. HaHaR_3_96]|uniref:HAD family hydrolase n=1 Tax=Olleya sp. HaHaR_3_96 TaxID=2745560 RepID=UPI001C500D68|nr:HAD family hydrolase [Olleya sp. HaHaR_3_96]QXP61794.1 HAD family hydrolase [Olleya sp. HaHaR_3_96]